MGFSRQECWSGLPFPSPGDLPNPGIEAGSPAVQADALLFEPPGKHDPELHLKLWRMGRTMICKLLLFFFKLSSPLITNRATEWEDHRFGKPSKSQLQHFLWYYACSEFFWISPEYSLEGLILKLKLQYFGHLMGRTDSLGKKPDAGKDWRRKRGQQGMRWLDDITDWSWWRKGKPGMLQSRGGKELDMTEQLNWLAELRTLLIQTDRYLRGE